MASTAVMNLMLSWLKGLATWILGLFNLAGSSGFSPLNWLSDHWLSLLITLMIIGVVCDIVVWLLRWRPYWVWFNKKRIVIEDDRFFDGEELVDAGLYDPALFADSAARKAPPRRAPSTIVPPRRKPVFVERLDDDGMPLAPRRPAPRRSAASVKKRDAAQSDPIFAVEEEAYPKPREDVAFDVSDLPVSKDELAFRRKRRTTRRR